MQQHSSTKTIQTWPPSLLSLTSAHPTLLCHQRVQGWAPVLYSNYYCYSNMYILYIYTIYYIYTTHYIYIYYILYIYIYIYTVATSILYNIYIYAMYILYIYMYIYTVYIYTIATSVPATILHMIVYICLCYFLNSPHPHCHPLSTIRPVLDSLVTLF